MTTKLPAKLKSADISRFALRASQLETARPAIAYWCEYWIVNQLIARGLHTADEECLKYTTTLMDKLEQTKAAHSSDETIVDDTAGQAYVEQFALETFERADRAVQADKVTKQTADTFLAASTFLELLNIWGEPGQEIHAKIRYAKWNAVRIVKAFKEGKDPNESNPKPEPSPEENLEPLDPNDPEVQHLNGGPSMQASVEEVPDEQDNVDHQLASESKHDQSLHPSAQPSAQPSPGSTKFEPYPRDAFPYTAATRAETEVSPMKSSPHDRAGSIGGGYFPEVPSGTRSPALPSAPSDEMDITSPPPELPSPSHLPPGRSEHSNPAFLPPPSPPVPDILQPSAPPSIPPQDYYRSAVPPSVPPVVQPPSSFNHQAPSTIPASVAPPSIPSQPQPFSGKPVYNTDDVAIAKAQKHARWAISALNFEDAETAVKELKAALQTLGA